MMIFYFSMNDAKQTPRAKIDEIDSKILRLLNERAAIALEVGEAKSVDDRSLCDPNREREVLKRLSAENKGPFDDANIANIFQRIIDESLLLQQRKFHSHATGKEDRPAADIAAGTRVAFLGDRGTFSEEAALALLGEKCQTVSCATFEDLFRAIDLGSSDLIIAPLENSLVGSIHRCFDLLLESDLHITAEVVLPVSHFLIACEAATMDSIRTVESHPAALAQCGKFFASHPNLRGIAADDTAGSVRRAVESGDVTRAGIGGKRTAKLYGGKILREHIEDHRDNFTRFALLGKTPDERQNGSKVSLVMTLKNQPGALHNALRAFVRRGIDLLKIESRPIKNSPKEFNFYIDLAAPPAESELRGALEEITQQAAAVRVLGRYTSLEVQQNDLDS
ncbi:MAG: prephenate dehydratase [Pyrinomonadaceae bacterium]|nr:prephenate dehydratase [Pyrinomonadaceae bacterium]